ncbi:MAG TPA: chemotaxis protein CheB [Burkholderiaceae bacterium]|nr:chemotaxis protein CheB [Burkholderiaceae bacterium]
MRRYVVIGASTGGIAALNTILSGLARDFPAPIMVVQHIGAYQSILPEVLGHNSPLTIAHAADGDEILPGHVMIAPPDHHMVVGGDGRINIYRGPQENYARPAIDPLFRSAALRWQSAVIGVLLSGQLDDGTAGLQAIKRRGGYAIVQDPADAIAPSMPESALRHAAVDLTLPVNAIAKALAELLARPEVEAPKPADDLLADEHLLHLGRGDHLEQLRALGQASGLTCPACGGGLWAVRDSWPARYRCHTGHGFSARTLDAAMRSATEERLWAALRAIQEQSAIYRQEAPRLRADRKEELIVAVERLDALARLLRDLIESMPDLYGE